MNPDGTPRQPPPPTAYADASTSVIVKNGDVVDLTLAVKEAATETAAPAAASPAVPAPQ